VPRPSARCCCTVRSSWRASARPRRADRHAAASAAGPPPPAPAARARPPPLTSRPGGARGTRAGRRPEPQGSRPGARARGRGRLARASFRTHLRGATGSWQEDALKPVVGIELNLPIQLGQRRAALEEADARLARDKAPAAWRTACASR
jgi:hypothetical protein